MASRPGQGTEVHLKTIVVVATVLLGIAGARSAAAGECAPYGKQVENQCLAAAKKGQVRRMSVAQKLCRDAGTYATNECKREFSGMGEYFEQAVASKGYTLTRCEYRGWLADQFVYWTYINNMDGKYAGTWDDVVRPIGQSITDIATSACKRKL